MKPMMAQIIPIIPQANCLLIMAIIPNKSERGTNIGDKKNIKLRFDDTYMKMASDGKL